MEGEVTISRQKHFTLTTLHPCATKEGRVLAEIQLHRTFQPAELCDRIAAAFPQAECNPELGVCHIQFPPAGEDPRGDKAAIIFATGKVTIQRAESAQDALRIFARIASALGIPVD